MGLAVGILRKLIYLAIRWALTPGPQMVIRVRGLTPTARLELSLSQRSRFRFDAVNGQNGGANLVANAQLELPALRQFSVCSF